MNIKFINNYRKSVEYTGLNWRLHISIIGLLAVVLAITLIIECIAGRWDDVKSLLFVGVLGLIYVYIFLRAFDVVIYMVGWVERDAKTAIKYRGVVSLLIIGIFMGWVSFIYLGITPPSMEKFIPFINVLVIAPLLALLVAFIALTSRNAIIEEMTKR